MATKKTTKVHLQNYKKLISPPGAIYLISTSCNIVKQLNLIYKKSNIYSKTAKL